MSNAAQRDLTEKIRLERVFRQDLGSFNTRLTRRFMREWGIQNTILQASELNAELEALLLLHYGKVQQSFANEIRPTLAADVVATEEEDELIDGSLAIFFASLAVQQTRIITGTNQTDINEAVLFGIAELQEDPALSQMEIAVVAGSLLARRLRGRLNTIAITETQIPAETAKGTEAEVLSGRQPSIQAPNARPADMTKQWITVGDENVRSSHAAADLQKVDLAGVFIVQSQELRWPGDSSLGATADNVINCRCTAVYPNSAAFAERRRKGEAPMTERELSPQAQVSLDV